MKDREQLELEVEALRGINQDQGKTINDLNSKLEEAKRLIEVIKASKRKDRPEKSSETKPSDDHLERDLTIAKLCTRLAQLETLFKTAKDMATCLYCTSTDLILAFPSAVVVVVCNSCHKVQRSHPAWPIKPNPGDYDYDEWCKEHSGLTEILKPSTT